jgi:hypothetical protein
MGEGETVSRFEKLVAVSIQSSASHSIAEEQNDTLRF